MTAVVPPIQLAVSKINQLLLLLLLNTYYTPQESTIKSVSTHHLLGDFERLSRGGYGDLKYIKSIWIDSPGPGDQTPRLVVSNGNVYSRDGAHALKLYYLFGR